jgi:hypothetical protein
VRYDLANLDFWPILAKNMIARCYIAITCEIAMFLAKKGQKPKFSISQNLKNFLYQQIFSTIKLFFFLMFSFFLRLWTEHACHFLGSAHLQTSIYDIGTLGKVIATDGNSYFSPNSVISRCIPPYSKRGTFSLAEQLTLANFASWCLKTCQLAWVNI